jgi:membrane fusion protein (multidrug efflux system)
MNKFSQIVSLGGLILVGCNQHVTAPVAPKPSRQVTITYPSYHQVKRHLTTTAEVSLAQTIAINYQGTTPTIVSQVLVTPGTYVQQGQVLARLESSVASYEMIAAQAKMQAAAAQVAKDQQLFAHDQFLLAHHALSTAEVTSNQTSLHIDQAKLNEAKAGLALARINLNKHTIIAPIAGMVSVSLIKPAQPVNPNQELMRMVSAKELTLDGRILADDLSVIQVPMPVMLSDGQQQESGIIQQVTPQINPTDAMVHFQIATKYQPWLTLGKMVKVTIPLAPQSSLIIPQTAVFNQNGYYYVMRLTAKQQVSQTKVSLSGFESGFAILTTPLAQNQALIANGADLLEDGETVTVTKQPR